MICSAEGICRGGVSFGVGSGSSRGPDPLGGNLNVWVVARGLYCALAGVRENRVFVTCLVRDGTVVIAVPACRPKGLGRKSRLPVLIFGAACGNPSLNRLALIDPILTA